ncbi:hypothetical protein CDD80_348 [Ophiocordyceps camponoti-rufipedis]|uniref:C2H2-type domain-containing protein n=1 Tax=Ophiocordyceps camponoti-rufipedis TaxID=2004952 RepID=A0A2C5YRE7_9HYPO|nr:hypothetical protein CDD80_348 [Ophiocordyceps camponoti-rufipedis]
MTVDIISLACQCDDAFDEAIASWLKAEPKVASLVEFRQYFSIWTAHLNVFAPTELSLDARLEKDADLADIAVSQRSTTEGQGATSAEPDSTYAPLADQSKAFREVELTLARLNRLGVFIQRIGSRDLNADPIMLERFCDRAIKAHYSDAHRSLHRHLSVSMAKKLTKLASIRQPSRSKRPRHEAFDDGLLPWELQGPIDINKDLLPLVCLWEGCYHSFSEFSDWSSHMSSHNRTWTQRLYPPTGWLCPVCEPDSSIFPSTHQLHWHIETSHAGKFTESDLDVISRNCAIKLKRSYYACLFCSDMTEPKSEKEGMGAASSQQQHGSGDQTSRVATPELDDFEICSDSSSSSEKEEWDLEQNPVTDPGLSRHIAEHVRGLAPMILRLASMFTETKDDGPIRCDAATTNIWPCWACIRLKLHCVRPNGYDGAADSTPMATTYESVLDASTSSHNLATPPTSIVEGSSARHKQEGTSKEDVAADLDEIIPSDDGESSLESGTGPDKNLVSNVDDPLSGEFKFGDSVHINYTYPSIPRLFLNDSHTDDQERDGTETKLLRIMRSQGPMSLQLVRQPHMAGYGKRSAEISRAELEIRKQKRRKTEKRGFDPSHDENDDVLPHYSMRQMITQALMDSPDGKLSGAEIYHFITKTYSFYRHSQTFFWQIMLIVKNLKTDGAFEEITSSTKGEASKWQLRSIFKEEMMCNAYKHEVTVQLSPASSKLLQDESGQDAQVKASQNPPRCDICQQSFSSYLDEVEHRRVHAQKTYACRGSLKSGGTWGCGRHFVRFGLFVRHLQSEVGGCIKPLLQESMSGERQDAEKGKAACPVDGNLLSAAVLQQHPDLAGFATFSEAD